VSLALRSRTLLGVSSVTTLLLLLLVVGLVFGVYMLLGRQTKLPTKGSRRRARQQGVSRPLPRWRRILPIVLVAGAVACLIVALAQFRTTKTGRPGTVMLTIDASDSMNAKDVKPNRIGAAEAAARSFLDSLPANFPVGLVTFSDNPVVQVEPSQDHAQVSEALGNLTLGLGTVIGDGLQASLDEIHKDWTANGRRPAAIILLSDGRDTGSRTPPAQAAANAAAAGVPVYTVVLGNTDPGTKGSANAALLGEIAHTTGAQSYSAATANQLTSIYEDLGAQLSTALKLSSSAALFMVLAIVLAIAAALVVLLGTRPEF
jgi:Ca-activated chloride channel homolog